MQKFRCSLCNDLREFTPQNHCERYMTAVHSGFVFQCVTCKLIFGKMDQRQLRKGNTSRRVKFLFCLFVCLELIVPLENFSLIWRRHHYRRRAANFYLWSAIAIEQWGFFSEPHLLWQGASVYNGHIRGPVTLTPIAERLVMELSLPVYDLGLSRLGRRVKKTQHQHLQGKRSRNLRIFRGEEEGRLYHSWKNCQWYSVINPTLRARNRKGLHHSDLYLFTNRVFLVMHFDDDPRRLLLFLRIPKAYITFIINPSHILEKKSETVF